MNKVCPRCQVEKTNSEFYNYKRSKDGLSSWCKECICGYKRQTYAQDVQLHRLNARISYQSNIEYYRQRYKRDPERYKQNNQRWRKNNTDNLKLYNAKRRQSNMLIKLHKDIRSLIYHSLRNRNLPKTSKTTTIVGCSIELLKNHLEYSFWLNYGRYPTHDDKLHIDHIIPVSTVTTEDELIKLNHYSNLQYLLASDNISKGNRYLT
jgi:hypothetical protein